MDAAPQHPASGITPGSVTDQDATPAHTPVSFPAPGIHTSYGYGYGDGYGDGYPPHSELVDEADMFHIWVLPGRLPFSLAMDARK